MRRFVRLSFEGQRVYVNVDAIEVLSEEEDEHDHWTVIDLTNTTVAVDQSAADIISKIGGSVAE